MGNLFNSVSKAFGSLFSFKWQQMYVLALSVCLSLVVVQSGLAADEEEEVPADSSASSDSSSKASPRGVKVNLDSLKKNFGTANTRVSVVQSRLYPKKYRLELGAYSGVVSTDAFINTAAYGGHLGFYFSEYFGLSGLYWMDQNSKSDALTAFESQNGFSINTVEPKSFLGGEVVLSPIYGKLSVMNFFVLHYDFHLLLGGGVRNTESGNYFAPLFGLGQQVFLSKYFFLRMDYRKFYFTENINEKVIKASLGQVIGSRTNTSGVFTVGLGVFLF